MQLRGFLAGFTAAVLLMTGVVTVARTALADSTCGAVIGMSVVRNAYAGSTLDDTGAAELIWHPGSVLGDWANPDSRIWDNLRVENDCGDPTWATFGFDPTPVRRIDGYAGSNQDQFDALLDAAIANIRAHWPTIADIDAWLIVGVEHDEVCYAGSREVRATQLHRDVQKGLDSYLGRNPDVGAGPEIHIDCAGFADWIGHLNEAGQAEAGAYLDAWYLGTPEPETTTTLSNESTTSDEPTTTSVESTSTSVEETSTTVVEVTTTTEASATTTTEASTTTTSGGPVTTTTTLPACEPVADS